MRINGNGPRKAHAWSKGFSTLELLIVISIAFIMAAIAIPGYNNIRRALRIAGDGRDLNGTVNQAKMQAAADFTRARVSVDLAANTFHAEIWNKALNCWQTVDDADPAGNPRCTLVGTSPVQNLSQSVIFGFGGVAVPPPKTQGAIAQAPACQNIAGGAGTIPNSACVVFNSRGMPVDINGAPAGNQDALYITDNNTVYGLTVGPTGITQVWATSAGAAGTWYHK